MLEELILSPMGQWVMRYKRALSLGALATMLWFGWQAAALFGSNQEQDSLLEEKFLAWKKDLGNEPLYQSLKSDVKKLSGPHPLRAEIAQALLSLGRVEEAAGWARSSIEQLRRVAPDYAEFADISFLIGQKKHQEALERAVSLKEALEDRGSMLYGKNLVRIAFLQQVLENRAGEIAAWGELEELSRSRDKIWEGLANRKSDFQAYLIERKKSL